MNQGLVGPVSIQNRRKQEISEGILGRLALLCRILTGSFLDFTIVLFCNLLLYNLLPRLIFLPLSSWILLANSPRPFSLTSTSQNSSR